MRCVGYRQCWQALESGRFDTLRDEGIALRHVDEGKNVAMFRTSIPTEPNGTYSLTISVLATDRHLPAALRTGCAPVLPHDVAPWLTDATRFTEAEVEEIKDFLKDPSKYKALGARKPAIAIHDVPLPLLEHAMAVAGPGSNLPPLEGSSDATHSLFGLRLSPRFAFCIVWFVVAALLRAAPSPPLGPPHAPRTGWTRRTISSRLTS